MIQLNDVKIKDIVESLMGEVPFKITAALIYGPFAGGYADSETVIDILIIVESSKLILKHYFKQFNTARRTRLLVVDKRTFEKDVEKEWLGGVLAENILTPYSSLLNESYLWNQEVKAKKTVINDILTNLILDFPEMSRIFLIKPEFFMFELMIRRATLFPLMTYRFLNITRSDVRERNRILMMKGFNAAVKDLFNDGKIQLLDDGFIKISEECISSVRKKYSCRLAGLFRNIRVSIIRHVLSVFPNIMDSLMDDYRIYKSYFIEDKSIGPPLHRLENPKKYIFIPTASGIIPFIEKITIDKFIRKYMPGNYSLKYSIKRLGGVFNSVYILRFFEDKTERKIVVKIFKDWYGWKWFPLALWALGTKNFTVLGKTRLEREYALNLFLSSNGINVPRIIYVSPEEKIIFQEYIDGINASKIIRQLYRGIKDKEEEEKLLNLIKQIGCEIAKVHSLGISIGDCKPENILITQDRRIFFVDLEQAERNGDQAWDISEFLYYSGHYALLPPLEIIEKITKEFLYGYLKCGGKMGNIRKASSPRYIKVFSFFTPPHLLFTISNLCRKILKNGTELSSFN